MSSLAARILDAIDPTAASKAAAVLGQQAPTVDQLAADSAASAKLFGSGDADSPAVEPIYEPARPVIADVTDPQSFLPKLAELLRPPAPDSSVAAQHAVGASNAVQVLPPSGRRRRLATVRNTGSATVYVSPDRRGDTSGFVLVAGQDIEVDSASPVWAICATGDTSTVCSWADYFPEG